VKNAYTFHSDPGHCWLEVPKAELRTLGISEVISRYSYERAGDAFLEEDCDFPVFHEAYTKKYGEPPKIVEKSHGSDCFIRRLNKYA